MDESLIPSRAARLQALPGAADDRLVPPICQIRPPILDIAFQEAAVPQHRVGLAQDVVTGARPRIVLSPFDEAGTDRIVFDEADLLEDAPVIQYARQEPPLPEVAGHPLLAVEVLGVFHVERVERPGERASDHRDADVMDVVPHQAVGPDLDGVAVGAFLEPGEVAPEIGLLFEDGLVVVATLGDLVRVPDDSGTG